MKDLGSAIARIRAIPGYAPYFAAAFGPGDVINIDNAAKAIAAYERTQITPGSPYDRYVQGDKTALTAQQASGMKVSPKRAARPATRRGVRRPGIADGHPVPAEVPAQRRQPVCRKVRPDGRQGPLRIDEKPADEHMWRVPQPGT